MKSLNRVVVFWTIFGTLLFLTLTSFISGVVLCFYHDMYASLCFLGTIAFGSIALCVGMDGMDMEIE